MGAVSVSIGSPSRRSRSSSLIASARISGPMPSPGRRAIFTAPAASGQPRVLCEMLRFERAYFVRVLQAEADLVEAVQEAMLAKRLDLEPKNRCAVDARHRLPLEVDVELEPGKRGCVVEQPVDLGFGEHDGQQAILIAVGEENVGVGRRDQGAKTIVDQRPGRMLA